MGDADDDFDASGPLGTGSPELNELLGMFDLPAFARRGQDMEYSVRQVHDRCRNRRGEYLEMVRMRLRQWAAVAQGPGDWEAAFTAPIDELWRLADAQPPRWADRPASLRLRRAAARDLAASVRRFNDRWRQLVASLNLGPANRIIDHYNRYYLLEKECVLGSARLAARYFTPIPPFSHEMLLETYPPLPQPELRAERS
ncbi:hypothetical protein OJF2_58650 [Aquisphaera giovannonii]|uniref:Uncharacterized protein n=1 Tax=Aquisphaera giovannonii TaxID=406548 RepID=A0A5B9W9G3_9BACT|nr:hypothetical protein [Aquisphaera giovannonii]QEH37278.1 hypothetical protein OJF2_58650 [Aquisphaera giovannonii]